MLALPWDTETQTCQLAQGDDGSITTDEGLDALVKILLFTDRRASDEEVERFNLDDPRGWWADSLRAEGVRELGSRLWLLERDKLALPAILSRARSYAREALAPLVDDGIASSVDVQVTTLGAGALGIGVTIVRGSAASEVYRSLWEYTINAVR